MKAAERLAQRLGSNIDESMGARRDPNDKSRAGGSNPPPPRPIDASTIDRFNGATRMRGAFNIRLDYILPDPDQPRKEFDEGALVDLASSLRTRGQLQAIRVRWDAERRLWIIVTGERRWRAAQLAGLRELACVESDEHRAAADLLEDQLVENCLREDLSPIEQAKAFQRLLDAKQCSYRELAETLNISHQSIVRALKLLGLVEDVQEQVEQGALSTSVASELADLPDPEQQRDLAAKIVREKLNRDAALSTIRETSQRLSVPARAKATRKGKKKASPTNLKFTVENGLIVEVHPATAGQPLAAHEVVAALRQALEQAEAASRHVEAA